MSVSTRYTVIGEMVIEFITMVSDGNTTLTVNVLPPTDAQEPQPDTLGIPESTEAPPPETVLAGPPTKKKRTLMGIIRAGWFYVFTALGGVIDYSIQKYTDLPVPTGTATVIGGALYGLKRALYPDTVL